MALSSTTSTRRPLKATLGTRSCSGSACAGSTMKVKVKVLPTLGMLTTLMLPPMRSTSCLQIASPRPVPPKLRVVEASTWLNGLNRRPMRSAGMPMPVSRTATEISSRLSARARDSRLTTISPWLVNLTALPSRLTRTCRTRPASPLTLSATLGSTIVQISSRFSAAAGIARSTASSIVLRKSKA